MYHFQWILSFDFATILCLEKKHKKSTNLDVPLLLGRGLDLVYIKSGFAY